jgi:polyhydroxyalkanoate synthase
VAPWRSTYKIHRLTDTEVTYLLTSGGHNAGIVSEPGRDGRKYQVLTKTAHDYHVDADTWAAEVPHKDGSWWPQWLSWLDARSGAPVEAPGMGAPAAGFTPLGSAPGSYVLQE